MLKPRTLVSRSPVVDRKQANQLLPLVKLVAARILRRVLLSRRLSDEVQALHVLSYCSGSPGDLDFLEFVDKSVRYHRLRGQVDALVESLAKLGCSVRNHDTSHVDFTFMRDDGLAFLCWRKDETEVQHWHYMDEAHERRRPLVETTH